MDRDLAARLSGPRVQCCLKIDVLKRRQHTCHHRALCRLHTKKISQQRDNLIAPAAVRFLIVNPLQKRPKRSRELAGLRFRRTRHTVTAARSTCSAHMATITHPRQAPPAVALVVASILAASCSTERPRVSAAKPCTSRRRSSGEAA